MFQRILNGLSSTLTSVKDKSFSRKSENYVERNIESEWLVDHRVPVTISTNVIGNNLQFNVIIQTKVEHWNFDLIAGSFKKVHFRGQKKIPAKEETSQR